MATALIHALKRAAAVSSTSLLSKLAPPTAACSTSFLSKLVPTVFRRMCSDQDKDGLVHLRMEIPNLEKTKKHSTFFVDQNMMIIKDKSSGSEIERTLFCDSVDFHGLHGEIENGTASLWMPGVLSRLNGENIDPSDQVITKYEGGFYAQMKMSGVDQKDHFKFSVQQNKMKMIIVTEQATGSEGDISRPSAIVDLPPKLHMNGIKGEMKDGMYSLWLPDESVLAS